MNPVKYSDVNDLITTLCTDQDTTFPQRTESLYYALDALSDKDIVSHIDYGGVIPESYPHDSSEEKLFAKYCDYLLARSLRLLGLDADVIKERADAADVLAKYNNYGVVGDAKAFRLSRTAKNQKDFKVEALHQWKKGTDYAVLVCPLYQYPTRNSQIYEQAIRYNVTLLSFTHLGFLLRSPKLGSDRLSELWNASRSLSSGKDAIAYWASISEITIDITSQTRKAWDDYLALTRQYVVEQAREQLEFWEQEKERIKQLPHEVAVIELIKAKRIDSNINLINSTMQEFSEIIQAIE